MRTVRTSVRHKTGAGQTSKPLVRVNPANPRNVYVIVTKIRYPVTIAGVLEGVG